MKPWQHILGGVLLGLILAAVILLVIQSPDGTGIVLLPAPTRAPVVVHVAGAVGKPGVYELEQSSRVIDAINAAGGFTQEADRNALNLADLIQDGSMITVPDYHAESSQMDVKETITNLNPPENTLVNINTAGQGDIEMLPEIGQKKAAEIIAYRVDNGPFSTIEDIMDVPGIGPVIFEIIEEFITVE